MSYINIINMSAFNTYPNSFNSEYQRGICTTLNVFGLGSGDCSSYLDQTLTQYDAISYVCMSLSGYDWAPVDSPVFGLEMFRYISFFNVAIAFMAVLVIPELFILKAKYNIRLL